MQGHQPRALLLRNRFRGERASTGARHQGQENQGRSCGVAQHRRALGAGRRSWISSSSRTPVGKRPGAELCHHWVLPVITGCSLSPVGAPYHQWELLIIRGCSLSPVGDSHHFWVLFITSGSSLSLVTVPYHQWVLPTTHGVSLTTLAAPCPHWLSPTPVATPCLCTVPCPLWLPPDPTGCSLSPLAVPCPSGHSLSPMAVPCPCVVPLYQGFGLSLTQQIVCLELVIVPHLEDEFGWNLQQRLVQTPHVLLPRDKGGSQCPLSMSPCCPHPGCLLTLRRMAQSFSADRNSKGNTKRQLKAPFPSRER